MNIRILSLISLLLAALTARAAEPVEPDTLRVQQVGEAVVTGSNAATGRNLLPYSMSVVDGRQLEATGQPQLLAALSGRVPSLFVTERSTLGFGLSNGGSGGIKVRGVGGNPTNAILMMVDGQPQFAGIYSHHVADAYQTDNVERVEVLRGPASVLYGSNAMGGVVNVITKDARKQGAQTTVSAQYGSYNTLAANATNTLRYGKFSSLVSLGYDRSDGNLRRLDYYQTNLYAKVGYDLSDRWKATADYSLVRFVGDDAIYPRLSRPESTDVYHQNITRGALSLAVANRYRRTDGNVRLYYSYGNHFVDDPRHFHSTDDRLGLLAYQNFRPWRGATLTVGFDFDTYTGRIPVSGGTSHTEGSFTTLGRKRITEYSPYVMAAQSLVGNLLTLNAGLRMANSDCFGTAWIQQGGVALNPGKGWSVKASVAKGYRNPSFRELYLYRTANAGLQPESMLNCEVTLGKSFSRYFAVDVTGYWSRGTDLIQIVEGKNANAGRFINKGIEVSATSHPFDVLMLRASYSYLHTSLPNLTGAPKNQYYVGATWLVDKKFTLDAELRGVGGLYVDNSFADWQYDHQSYVLLGLKATYRPCRFIELSVKADNIANARYTINPGYEMPGSTAMFGVKAMF